MGKSGEDQEKGNVSWQGKMVAKHNLITHSSQYGSPQDTALEQYRELWNRIFPQ